MKVGAMHGSEEACQFCSYGMARRWVEIRRSKRSDVGHVILDNKATGDINEGCKHEWLEQVEFPGES
jgi:hypothetical protein